jgi:hypothetical protein
MAAGSNRRFTLIAIVFAALAVAVAVALALTGPLPPLAPLLLLGFLVAVAENRCILLPNQTSVSASFMLSMAAVVVFRDDAPLLGPLLVGMCVCLLLDHLRVFDWRKILANAGIGGLATFAAAATYYVIPDNVTSTVWGQLLSAVPAGLTYSLVDFAMLSAAAAVLTKRSLRDVSDELWLGDLQVYPFAVMGVMLGSLYVSLGAWVVPLFVAPIFIARQAFASYQQLKAQEEATLQTLIRSLEAKNAYTAGHVERVAQFATYVGEELGMNQRRLQRLRHAALMHDIGKLTVPNQLLNKPGKLTAAEFDRVRQHEQVSVELLRRIDFLEPVLPTVAAEAGSLDRMASAPIESHIITVADAFDAMTSTRSYRRALSQEVAFAELRAKVGTQFHPDCVEALITAITRRAERYGAGYEEAQADFAVPPPVAGVGSAGLGDLEAEQQGRAAEPVVPGTEERVADSEGRVAAEPRARPGGRRS